MSSILKALKKLEQSKALRRESDHDMTWFVRGETSEPISRRRYWSTILALVGVAATAVFATYVVMMQFAGPPRRDTVARSTDGRIPASSVVKPPDPAIESTKPSAKAAAPLEVKPAAVSGDLRSRATNSRRKMPLPSGNVAVMPKPGPVAGQGKLVRADSAQPKPRKTDVAAIASPSVPEPPAARENPSLHVGGIAWQKDSSSPMAIVNGTPVAEGSTISGARVEKIYQERVRFSYQGRFFDVGLGSSSSNR